MQAFTANYEYGSVLSIFSIFRKNLHKMVYSSKMNSSVAAATRLVVSVACETVGACNHFQGLLLMLRSVVRSSKVTLSK